MLLISNICISTTYSRKIYFLSSLFSHFLFLCFLSSLSATNFGDLGAFKFEGTLAEIKDLLDFHDVDSPKDLYEQLVESDKGFCEPEEIEPSEKIPTTCVGPSVVLELQPKTCVLETKDKTLVCDPAKLVLTKFPGECTYKYKSAFFYKGKECKFTASIGTSKEAVIGGGEFSIDFEKTGATVTVPEKEPEEEPEEPVEEPEEPVEEPEEEPEEEPKVELKIPKVDLKTPKVDLKEPKVAAE